MAGVLGFFRLRKSVCIRSVTLIRNFHRLSLSAEVKCALAGRQPVVALESTIMTHGMPFPRNFETALAVEEIIRDQGATPATIGVLRGEVTVGLSPAQMSELAEGRTPCVKVSRRDLPYVVSNKLNGGTTVAGTMIIADRAGIPVFVTGGIGGVHREGQNTFDISADLTELGRTPIAVISSGVKSILDIGRTLEYLETQGVLVATYGPSKEFPSFYCRGSAFKSPYNVASPKEAAVMIDSCLSLCLSSGLLLAVPIPQDFSLEESDVEAAIAQGLAEAARLNIAGKEVTPFLLSQITQLTGGKSLDSNIALIKNNAFVGATVAVELSKIRVDKPRDSASSFDSTKSSGSSSSSGASVSEVRGGDSAVCGGNSAFPRKTKRHHEVVVIGGSIVDCVVTCLEPEIKLDGRSLNGKMAQVGGGVARNMADALGKLKMHPLLISAVGKDEHGAYILRDTIPHLVTGGMMQSTTCSTSVCWVLCDVEGQSQLIVGNLDIHGSIDVAHVGRHVDAITTSSLVVLDGNVPLATAHHVLDICKHHSVPVWFEPTDIMVAHKIFTNPDIPRPNFISPNQGELVRIHDALFGRSSHVDEDSDAWLKSVVKLALRVAEHIDFVILTAGKEGVVIVGKGSSEHSIFNVDNDRIRYNPPMGNIHERYYATKKIDASTIVNSSGAGDCFASGFISAMLSGLVESGCVENGFKCSEASLRCSSPVPPVF